MRKCLTGSELSIVIIILIALAVCGCASPGPAGHGASALPTDKYVALYEEYDVEGTVLEGDGTIMFIPAPCPVPHPFDYNGTRGFLEEYPTVNDDLKAMYGWYMVYSSPATWFSTARYRGIYSLPYTLDSKLTIREIDANGTIIGSYYDANVTLKVGDVWRSMVTSIVKNESHYIADNLTSFSTSSMRPFLIQYNYSWTVENKGVFPKVNITR